MIYSMSKEEKEHREQMGELSDRMGKILDNAKAQGRKELADQEQEKFDELDEKFKNMARQLKHKFGVDYEAPNRANGLPFGAGEFRDGKFYPTPNSSGDVETWRSISGPSRGQEVKVLGNNRSLKGELDILDESQDWRDYMRGRIAGFTGDHSLESREMSTTSDSSLVPEPLSAQVIDLARKQSKIFTAGARTIPMTSKTLTIAKITQDAQPEWKAENAAITSSDVNTAPLVFTAHTLAANVKMSVELSEDAPNGSQIIQNSLAKSLALELDRVALVGSGSDPEPQGIYGADNVQSVDMGTDGTALSGYGPYSNAYQKILEANGNPESVIHAPRTFGALDRLTASDGQPLMAPQSYQNLQKLVTSQVPIDMTKGEADNASIAILADYRQLMVGIRTNLRIEVTRVASDDSGSAWENLQVWVRAYLRADIQLAHPDHFCVIDGIVPA